MQISHAETGSGPPHFSGKSGTGIPPDQKESLFVWAPAKTSGPNLFFIREILDMTGIVIEETGDMDTTRFVIRVPKGGYRIP